MTGELAVALGAAVGAPCRYLLDAAVRRRVGDRLPWGTLVVNLIGCAAAGLVVGLSPDPLVLTLLAVGVIGAFTTASTLAAEVVDLVREGVARAAAVLVALHVGLGLLLAGAGFAIGTALR